MPKSFEGHVESQLALLERENQLSFFAFAAVTLPLFLGNSPMANRIRSLVTILWIGFIRQDIGHSGYPYLQSTAWDYAEDGVSLYRERIDWYAVTSIAVTDASCLVQAVWPYRSLLTGYCH
jgi:hypothetical protein